jgi:hypothetical protein
MSPEFASPCKSQGAPGGVCHQSVPIDDNRPSPPPAIVALMALGGRRASISGGRSSRLRPAAPRTRGSRLTCSATTGP